MSKTNRAFYLLKDLQQNRMKMDTWNAMYEQTKHIDNNNVHIVTSARIRNRIQGSLFVHGWILREVRSAA